MERDQGLNCRVVDMFSVKPIDKELIEKCGRETGTIVTIEEHNILEVWAEQWQRYQLNYILLVSRD